MRSVTLSSPEDKNLVRKAVPTSKIFTAGVARLHVASPDPSKWTYSQVWGAAIFCIDKAKNNSFFIRLVDIQNNSGVIWEQELYVGFNYIKDASYFHSFETDDCLTALEFVDEGEADVFYKKVQGRDSLSAKATAPATESINNSGFGHRKTPSFSNTLNKRKSKIDKNHIGMPADFKHVGHIGYTPGKGFSVQNNDPEWNGIFDQLKELGISADEISDNQEFIQDFLQQNGTTLPSSPPPNQFQQRQQQQQQREIPITTAPPPIQTSRKKAPPPPPPPGRHHAPPPPPPPRRSNNNQSSPPPPPPARHPGPPVPNRGRPVPTPPPSMGGGFAPNPPQPPMGGVPPPPPPPPQPSMGGIPPPPPPPMMNNGNAPPPPPQMGSPPPPSGGDGRSDLMASIRSAGGFGTLKSSGKLREAEKSAPPTTSMANQAASTATGAAAGAAGGNLASSLADVLKQRKQAMQSDDEDEDDDEWE